jgi:DNA-binding MarR family transcriptional regulator
MNEKDIFDELDRIMRLIRRSRGKDHRGRGHRRILEAITVQGTMPTRELAVILDVRPSSLNEILGRMEEDGLIIRSRSESDQRVVLAGITEAGTAELQRIREAEKAFRTKVSDVLTAEEKETFMRLAQKFADGLEESVPEEPEHRNRFERRRL